MWQQFLWFLTDKVLLLLCNQKGNKYRVDQALFLERTINVADEILFPNPRNTHDRQSRDTENCWDTVFCRTCTRSSKRSSKQHSWSVRWNCVFFPLKKGYKWLTRWLNLLHALRGQFFIRYSHAHPGNWKLKRILFPSFELGFLDLAKGFRDLLIGKQWMNWNNLSADLRGWFLIFFSFNCRWRVSRARYARHLGYVVDL